MSGLAALKSVDLEIPKGEIFALLGPNGAGKTTLISILCGIVTPTTGTVLVDGHDIVRDYRASRSKIGLVPQEPHTDMSETVWNTVSLFNPIVYLISGFRWSFYGTSDVGVEVSLAATLGFLLLCLGGVVWIFRTGYRLKS